MVWITINGHLFKKREKKRASIACTPFTGLGEGT